MCGSHKLTMFSQVVPSYASGYFPATIALQSSSRAARDAARWPAEGLGLVEAFSARALWAFGFQFGRLWRGCFACARRVLVASWWGGGVLSTPRPISRPGGFSTLTRHRIIALHR
jgi:hypothetical protein